MVYGELGRYPIDIDVKIRALGYWASLLTGSQSKLSCRLYTLLYNLHVHESVSSKWIQYVKTTLDECGFSNIWESQSVSSKTWLVKALKLRLQDQHRQTWSMGIFQQTKCINYRMFN